MTQPKLRKTIDEAERDLKRSLNTDERKRVKRYIQRQHRKRRLARKKRRGWA